MKTCLHRKTSGRESGEAVCYRVVQRPSLGDQPPPQEETYQGTIDHAIKNSQPGRDAIPIYTYKAAGPWVTRTLFLFGCEPATGIAPPIFYNDSMQVFAPKGSDELDKELVSRSPAEEHRQQGCEWSFEQRVARRDRICSLSCVSMRVG